MASRLDRPGFTPELNTDLPGAGGAGAGGSGAGAGGKTDKPAGGTGKTDMPAGGDMKKFPKAAAVCDGPFRADGKVKGGTALNIEKKEMSCEYVWNEIGGEKEIDGGAAFLKLMGDKITEAFKTACCGEMKKPDGGTGKPVKPDGGEMDDKPGDVGMKKPEGGSGAGGSGADKK